MIITISGTPGTGKTTIAKTLAKELGYDYIDLNEFARNAGLVSGRDETRDADEIDVEKLKEVTFDNDVVVDGHLGHYINSDISFVLRTEPNELKNRLSERDWSQRKVDENYEAEVMGVCSVESREHNETTVDFDTTKHTEETAAEILVNLVKGNNLKTEPIDWDMEKYL